MGQVYQFKVALKHYKKLWRRIEIEGSQTLGDFDKIIRREFSMIPAIISVNFIADGSGKQEVLEKLILLAVARVASQNN